MEAVATEGMRSLTLLNSMGDIEIAWDSTKDEQMRDLIAKKMKEGVRFFILKPVPFTDFYRKSQLKTMKDLKENRVKLGDEDLEKMFIAGDVTVHRTNNGGATIDTVRPAKDAKEASRSRTVGVRALQGG